MTKKDFTTVYIRRTDLSRIRKLKRDFEPHWSVIERALKKLEGTEDEKSHR